MIDSQYTRGGEIFFPYSPAVMGLNLIFSFRLPDFCDIEVFIGAFIFTPGLRQNKEEILLKK